MSFKFIKSSRPQRSEIYVLEFLYADLENLVESENFQKVFILNPFDNTEVISTNSPLIQATQFLD